MLRVGVIRGGISNEHEISLQTGSAILRALHDATLTHKYKPIDLLLSREGILHYRGIPMEVTDLPQKVDVVVNALHGYFGEDGKIQKLFDDMGVRYTGSGALASALAMHKGLAKERFREIGINVPEGFEITYRGDYGAEHAKNFAKEIWQKMAPPWVVKPVSGGSSLGTHVCKTFGDLARALEENFAAKNDVLIEELITGREATVGIIDDYRGEEHYALPPIEVGLPQTTSFFDYDAKYADGGSRKMIGTFGHEERAALIDAARLIHKAFNLRHYSRSDFIVHPRRGVYVLEVNTLPGLTEHSFIPHAVGEVGGTFPGLVDHFISLAAQEK